MNQSVFKSSVSTMAIKQYYYLRAFEFAARLFFVFAVFPGIGSLFKLIDHPTIQNWQEWAGLFYYALLAIVIPNQIRSVALGEIDTKRLLRRINSIKWVLLVLTFISLICSLLLLHVEHQQIKAQNTWETLKNTEQALNYYFRLGFKLFPPQMGYLLITFLSFYLAQVLKVAGKLKEEQDLTI